VRVAKIILPDFTFVLCVWVLCGVFRALAYVRELTHCRASRACQRVRPLAKIQMRVAGGVYVNAYSCVSVHGLSLEMVDSHGRSFHGVTSECVYAFGSGRARSTVVRKGDARGTISANIEIRASK